MKYNAVNEFIGALKAWEELTKGKQATDIISLSFILNYKIGMKDNDMLLERESDNCLEILKNRIIYLIENENIDEIFLISSLSHSVTEILMHNINKHGDTIIFQQKMINKFQDSNSFTEIYERITSPDYIVKLKNDYYRWLEIVSINLSAEKFENWERDLLLDGNKDLIKNMKDMSEKYGNMTMGEVMAKELKK